MTTWIASLASSRHRLERRLNKKGRKRVFRSREEEGKKRGILSVEIDAARKKRETKTYEKGKDQPSCQGRRGMIDLGAHPWTCFAWAVWKICSFIWQKRIRERKKICLGNRQGREENCFAKKREIDRS